MKRYFDVDNFVSRFKTYCKICEIKEFQENEVITTYLLRRNQFFVLLDGEAQLVTFDKDGNRKILYYYRKNDVFGEALFQLYTEKELFVSAKKKCKVMFFPYDTAEHCTEDCMFHIELLRNLPDLILRSVSEQNFRMMLLINKSVRDKLLTYFQRLSYENSSKTFELPISLTELSDYLMIERTAMMREFKRMKDENIIKKNKNKITLL